MSTLIQGDEHQVHGDEEVSIRYLKVSHEACEIILDVVSKFSDIITNNMPTTCIYCLLYRKYFTY